MSRIHGRAKRNGEYQRNPITIVATAATATAHGLTPSNVSGPKIIALSSYIDCY